MSRTTRWIVATSAAVLVAWPVPARAQAVSEASRDGGDRPAFRIPQLVFSVGGSAVSNGLGAGSGGAPTAGSIQWLVTRHLVVEGEFAQWKQRSRGFSFREDVQSRSVGANLLFRTEPKRVSALVGIGMAWSRDRLTASPAENCTVSTCAPAPPESTRQQVGFVATTGADLRIAGPLLAYGTAQFTTLGRAHVRFTGGLRLVVLARTNGNRLRFERLAKRERDAATTAVKIRGAMGDEVRVSLASGERVTGTLVGFSASEVVTVRRNREHRYPVDQVLIVERTAHTARKFAIIGGVGGFLAGWLGSCGTGDEGDCWLESGAVLGGIGAGAGAIAGLILDRMRADSHVVYVAPGRARTTITPVLGRNRAGLTLAVQW